MFAKIKNFFRLRRRSFLIAFVVLLCILIPLTTYSIRTERSFDDRGEAIAPAVVVALKIIAAGAAGAATFAWLDSTKCTAAEADRMACGWQINAELSEFEAEPNQIYRCTNDGDMTLGYYNWRSIKPNPELFFLSRYEEYEACEFDLDEDSFSICMPPDSSPPSFSEDLDGFGYAEGPEKYHTQCQDIDVCKVDDDDDDELHMLGSTRCGEDDTIEMCVMRDDVIHPSELPQEEMGWITLGSDNDRGGDMSDWRRDRREGGDTALSCGSNNLTSYPGEMECNNQNLSLQYVENMIATEEDLLGEPLTKEEIESLRNVEEDSEDSEDLTIPSSITSSSEDTELKLGDAYCENEDSKTCEWSHGGQDYEKEYRAVFCSPFSGEDEEPDKISWKIRMCHRFGVQYELGPEDVNLLDETEEGNEENDLEDKLENNSFESEDECKSTLNDIADETSSISGDGDGGYDYNEKGGSTSSDPSSASPDNGDNGEENGEENGDISSPDNGDNGEENGEENGDISSPDNGDPDDENGEPDDEIEIPEDGRESPCPPYGDVSDSGYIGRDDFEILKDMEGTQRGDISDSGLKILDITTSGEVSSEDTNMMKGYLEGEIDDFPVCDYTNYIERCSSTDDCPACTVCAPDGVCRAGDFRRNEDISMGDFRIFYLNLNIYRSTTTLERDMVCSDLNHDGSIGEDDYRVFLDGFRSFL